jgi:hypothetical protein
VSKPSSSVRFGFAALAAIVLGLGVASSAPALVTIGQTAPSLEVIDPDCTAPGYDEIQESVAAGASYTVPTAGVLTSWSTNSKSGSQLGLKVFRPAGPSFVVIAADGPRALVPGLLNTFPVSIPVQAGDRVGTVVPLVAGGSDCPFPTAVPGDVLLYKAGNAPIGSAVPFSDDDNESGVRLNISATLLPPPAIAAIGPASATIKGGPVTITGANFAGVSAVNFGAVAVPFTVGSETQITATAPPSKSLTPVPVSVTTVAGTAASPQSFTYEGCAVPKLKGKKLKPSKRQARNKDCKIGKVTKRKGATAKTGKVIKQHPKPGTIRTPGTQIKVTLKP